MSKVKTLPEILDNFFKSTYCMTDSDHNIEVSESDFSKATKAIAKELMGCLPEGENLAEIVIKYGGSSYTAGWASGKNQALDEVRARLTAFIGHKEK